MRFGTWRFRLLGASIMSEAFFEELENAVTLRAHGSETYTLVAFVEEAVERLEAAEVVFDPTVIALQCLGPHAKGLRIVGYAEDAADSSLVVFCASHHAQQGATLGKPDAEAVFSAAKGFIEHSASGYLSRTLEVSSDEAQYARYFQDLLSREFRSSLATVERLKFILLTNATMSSRIRSIDSDVVAGRPASYAIWDLKRFEDLALSASGQDEFSVDLTEWVPGGLPCLVGAATSDLATSYLAVIPGRVLSDVYAKHGSQLLESNVRTFLSARGKVNKGIQRTLADQPEMFLAYNNGLTTTATGVEITRGADGPRLMRLHNWQIVNGGQTTASLAHFMRGASDRSIDSVHVAMKLVLVAPDSASETVSSISRFANSQNAVSEADLFSNSEFHIRLEQISRRLMAPALEGQQYQTKWFYERARGQWDNQRASGTASEAKRFEMEYPKRQRITKTDWAKYAFCWSQRPHEVSRGAQTNFMAYAKAASEKWASSPDEFGDDYFRNGVAKAIMYNELREAVMRSEWYSSGYLANIVAYAMSRFAYEVQVRYPGRKFDFAQVWRRQALSVATRTSLVDIARLMRGVLTADDRPQLNVTQWAKQEEAWKRAKQVSVVLDEGVAEDLMPLSEARSRAVEARRERSIDTSLEAQTYVLSRSQATWQVLLQEGPGAGVLSPTDIGLVELMARGSSVPTDRQASRLVRILERSIDAGVISSAESGGERRRQ